MCPYNSDYITFRQAVGVLNSSFDKVGYPEARDATNIILKFEENLLKLSSDEKIKLFVKNAGIQVIHIGVERTLYW